MEKYLLELLNDKNCDKKEIKSMFNIKDEVLDEILFNLEKKGEIYLNEHNDKYMLFNRTSFKKGIVKLIKNKPYVKTEDELIEIISSKVNNLRLGDYVIIDENMVNKVLVNSPYNIVGELYSKDGNYYVDDKYAIYDKKIKIEKDNTDLASNGHIVKVENNVIVDIVCHKNEPDSDILEIFNTYGFDSKFPDSVLDEIKEFPDSVTNYDDFLDLTNELCITIDGSDTKDIDDGIIIKKIANGYRVIVPNAIPSYYIKENSGLYMDIINRGTSCYAYDKVVPMMPPKLSNGICSLNPDVLRLCMITSIDIDRNGKLSNFRLDEAVIKSGIQMDYNSVNKILEENKDIETYNKYKQMLIDLQDISNIISSRLKKQGFLEFCSDEIKFNLVSEELELREQKTAEKIIENIALLVNSSKCEYLTRRGIPLIYRVHENPNQEKLGRYFRLLCLRGYVLKSDLKKFYSNKDIINSLELIRGSKEEKILNKEAIKAQARAYYSVHNLGHYATGNKYYAQFTSPIRRGGDFTNQYIERDYLHYGTDYVLDKYPIDSLESLAKHYTLKERMADECESVITKYKSACFMKKYLGCEFDGLISGISDFGMFVMLPNGVEGLIGISKLCDDIYIPDEDYFMLIGKNNGNRYLLGDEIKIKISKINEKDGIIDLDEVKVVENEEEKGKEKKKVKIR